MHTVTLRMHQALGDAVCLTALARDLKLQHPQYRVALDVNWRPVWAYNTRAELSSDPKAQRVEIGYTTGVQASKAGRPVHLIRALADALHAKTGVRVLPTVPRGELFLTPEEAEVSPVSGRYWVVFAGGKLDMTVKHWHTARYQGVVNRLRAYGVRVVQAGSAGVGHVHPPLANVLPAVGRTENPRDLFRLIKHADGVICGVTAASHIAAALDRPCVVIAGGREEPSFFGYTNAYLAEAFGPACKPVAVEHKVLHTVGLLHCCGDRGCWRKRTVPIDAKDVGRKDRICLEPVRDGEHPVARCMDMIDVEHVVEAVMSYYEDGMLPPIGKPAGKYPLPGLEHGVEMTSVLTNQQTLADIMKGWPAPPPLAFLVPPSLPERPAASPALPPELVPAEVPRGASAMDHPHVGGKFTAFVLCYGDHTDLAKRCLESILQTAPPGRLDLRVAANECSDRTLQYLRGLPLARLYVYAENRKKYPVMREIFRDATAPVATNYLLWFDDDSYVTNPAWLERLAETIAANHDHGGRHYGWLHLHDVKMFAKNGHDPRRWFQQSTSYRGTPLKVRGTRTPAPNGTVIEFVPGSFWALHTKTMLEFDIPEPRLVHNGGDITIGWQVTQAGFKTVGFNKDRQFVYTSGSPRRGYSERFPWANPVG